MKVTQAQIMSLLPGQELTVRCETAGELLSAVQVARSARLRLEKEGIRLTATRSVRDMTVRIARESRTRLNRRTRRTEEPEKL